MGTTQQTVGLVLEIESTEASASQTERFLKLSGYKATDVTGTNKSGVFVTSNGGKYSMDRPGKNLKTLAGPRYPNQNVEEDDEE